MNNRRALLLLLGAIGIITASAGIDAPAHAQSSLLPGGENAETTAEDAAIARADLEAQLARSKARSAEWNIKADAYAQAVDRGPARLLEIKREIEALKNAPPLVLESIPGAELEVRVLSAEQDLALAQREASDLAEQQTRRPERRRELPDLLADAKSRLSTFEQNPPVALSASPELAELQQQIAEARGTALESEVRAVELELVSYETRGSLLEANTARANLRIQRDEADLKALRAALTAQRESETQRAADQALASVAEVESLDPEVQEAVRRLATENATLAEGRTGEDGLLKAIDDVTGKLSRADRRVSAIEADYQRLTERVDTVGLSDSVGLLLRKTRSEVPDVGKYRRFIRLRQQRISDVQERQLQIREELAALSKIDDLVDRTLEPFSDSLSASDRARFASVLEDLLTTKRKHLTALLGDYDVYFQKLVDFDARQEELIEKTTDLLTFIDQRVLWVPSGRAVHPGVLGDALDGLGWLTTPKYWGQLARATNALFRQSLYLIALVLILMIAAIPLLQRRVAPRLVALKDVAQYPNCVEMRPTLEALGLSMLLVPWGPAVLLFLGWRLGVSADATLFVRCFAGGLSAAGWMWLTLEVPRQLLRRDGLCEGHFTWPPDSVRSFRTEITRVAAFAVPLIFFIQLFELRAEDPWRESLGRLALIVLLVVVAFSMHRLLRPSGPLPRILSSTRSIRTGELFGRLLHVGAVVVPIGLALAAIRGYYWTALQLGASYQLTLIFLFILFIALLSFIRWTRLARRRIAVRLELERREAERAERLKEDPIDFSGERSTIPVDNLDLAAVDQQTRSLLLTSAVVALGLGLWFIWIDVIPAFGVLDTIEVWTSTENVTVESLSADGTRLFESEQRTVPVTVANLLLALVVVFMTFVLVRNLSGLLEISLFRRLGTATGERYAFTTITQYIFCVIGGVIAFNAVGVGWDNIQWLVAAVGLGLGFGLQEIFANFIAGLIILFERPIRVGDTVTIGGISGTVTKIRIRATWITGFDRKELVVPNKEFVTTQLINWSLSDAVLRVDVPVGIAYGSDTERAMRELQAVAEANEHVLAEPRPDVLFLGFGDSALNFELRVYSPDVDHRLPIQHALHVAIDRAFREADIEIAFPQQDIHVRTTPSASGP